MRLLTSALLLLTLLVSAAPARQANTGELAGTIRDAAGTPIPAATVTLSRSSTVLYTTATDHRGEFAFTGIIPATYELMVDAAGFERAPRTVTVDSGKNARLTVVVQKAVANEALAQVVAEHGRRKDAGAATHSGAADSIAGGVAGGIVGGVEGGRHTAAPAFVRNVGPFNTEAYAHVAEAGFRRVADHPLSTFSVDVDTASYSNVRRFLHDGRLPPPDAVRTEELLNYFRFDYPQPTDEHPFSVTTEVGPCPWNTSHRLALVGLQGRSMREVNTVPRNLVFLLDVSGSMMPSNKLPLVKAAMRLLVDTLTEADRVAIVVYAGSSGVVLPPTPGSDKLALRQAIESLHAGGSTNGAAGIHAAYDQASAAFIRGGINRVILATDGDFNVGVTSEGELVRLIEEKRASGIFLSVLGVGEGNLKDAIMEKLADTGNGSYAYLDSLHEARKVLIEEAGGTLVTIAKDVKFQIEFNPATVMAYRLIGYENRVLENEDFNNDKRDAGDIGAGHTVTALYEIVPPGAAIDGIGTVDPLKYQESHRPTGKASSVELMTVKLRYKQPDGDTSRLLSVPVSNKDTRSSANLGFASAIAEFGMLLRRSDHRAGATYTQVLQLARVHRGNDSRGYRAEFIRLVELASAIDGGHPALPEQFRTR